MRLIDADALVPGIACHKQYTDQKYNSDRQWAIGYNAGIERALFSIRYAHTIEAEPVRHGRWIHDYNNLYGCSECMERETMPHRKLKHYCPNCGAKMDLK